MEIMDLYDKDRQKTKETYVRGSAQPRGLYRLIVHVCIFNSHGDLLIQQRTQNKKMPGLWDVTCGGAVSTNETSAMGAQRELFEELGIDINFRYIRPLLTANFHLGFDDFYVITKDIEIDKLILQAEEVADAKWASLDEVLSLRENGKFVKYKENFIRYLFELKDDNRYVEI